MGSELRNVDTYAIPRLNIALIKPLDTSSVEEEYLVRSHDGRMFWVSRSLAVILEEMKNAESGKEAIEKASRRIGTLIGPRDLEQIVERFLRPNHLLGNDSLPPDQVKRQSSLLLKLPIFRQQHLHFFTKPLRNLFHKPVLLTLIILGILVHILFYTGFLTSESSFFTGQQATPFYLFVLIILSVFFHELGHVSACRYYHCPHGAIGVGLYLFFPVFYAQVSETWVLKRRQRAIVDLGGIYFQLVLASLLIIFTLIYNIPLLHLAIWSIDNLILYNLNPFVKKDGYWLFSDLMGIPNLQEQAQNYLKGLLFRSRKRKWIPRKRERIIFRLYAFASSLFLIYFSWLVLKVTPHLLKSYPRTILMTGRRLYEGIMTLSPEVIIASSTMLLIELGMCLSLLYFLFSSLRRLVRWLSKQILPRPVHSV